MQTGLGPRVLELTGEPSALVYPPLCANCGLGADSRIKIERVFKREDSEDATTYVVTAAPVPFCPSCQYQHDQEAKKVTAVDRILATFRSFLMIPALCAAFAFLFFLPNFVKEAAEGDLGAQSIWGGVCLFFLLISLGSFRAAWQASRRYVVVPPTSITRSFLFTDDVSELFEGRRHRYTLTNAAFAEAFAQANQNRAWVRSGSRAQNARLVRWVLFGLVILVGLALAAGEIYQEIAAEISSWFN